MSVSDFRGISITSVLSKLFEMAILSRFPSYFETSDNQFGFKKQLGCSHAIFNVRNVIEHYINQASTVNVCLLDLNKAFDKMNHWALFTKLLQRKFPLPLIDIFILWFNSSLTCIKWGSCYSNFFSLLTSVRQGGVLSPHYFCYFYNRFS